MFFHITYQRRHESKIKYLIYLVVLTSRLWCITTNRSCKRILPKRAIAYWLLSKNQEITSSSSERGEKCGGNFAHFLLQWPATLDSRMRGYDLRNSLSFLLDQGRSSPILDLVVYSWAQKKNGSNSENVGLFLHSGSGVSVLRTHWAR